MTEDRLAHRDRLGALTGAPPPDRAPRQAAWDKLTGGSLDARAWLGITCAPLPQPRGPGAEQRKWT